MDVLGSIGLKDIGLFEKIGSSGLRQLDRPQRKRLSC
jgi:hypothetical protein